MRRTNLEKLIDVHGGIEKLVAWVASKKCEMEEGLNYCGECWPCKMRDAQAMVRKMDADDEFEAALNTGDHERLAREIKRRFLAAPEGSTFAFKPRPDGPICWRTPLVRVAPYPFGEWAWAAAVALIDWIEMQKEQEGGE